MDTRKTSLEIFADRIAIEEQFNQYADALDFKQWELLENFFSDNATAHWPTGETSEGREEIIDFIKNVLDTDEISTHHMISNFSVFFDGELAYATMRMRAYHAGKGAREGLFEESLAVFPCNFERTVQGWRRRLEEQILVMLGSMEVFAAPGADSAIPVLKTKRDL